MRWATLSEYRGNAEPPATVVSAMSTRRRSTGTWAATTATTAATAAVVAMTIRRSTRSDQLPSGSCRATPPASAAPTNAPVAKRLKPAVAANTTPAVSMAAPTKPEIAAPNTASGAILSTRAVEIGSGSGSAGEGNFASETGTTANDTRIDARMNGL